MCDSYRRGGAGRRLHWLHGVSNWLRVPEFGLHQILHIPRQELPRRAILRILCWKRLLRPLPMNAFTRSGRFLLDIQLKRIPKVS